MKAGQESSGIFYPFLKFLFVFLILHAGSRLSLLSFQDVGASDYYLPTSLAVILIYWVGPLYVIPMIFLNSVITSPLWGNSWERMDLWVLYAIPETICPLISWLLFRVAFRGKYWLPDANNTVLFLFCGVFIPAVIDAFSLQALLLWTGAIAKSHYWNFVVSNILGEFTASFCITFPALFYLTPILNKKFQLYDPPDHIAPHPAMERGRLSELAAVYILLLALAFILPFTKHWYIYGLCSMFVAIRFGFGPAITTNLYIVVITYVLPKVFEGFGKNSIPGLYETNSIFLAANVLFAFAAITGRVISDVKNAEEKLRTRNDELAQTNEELDRFIYSVSHDLSAPLKSIHGLVNISRMTRDPNEHLTFLERIEQSVRKLETFISEIIDYSKNKRQELKVEQVHLKTLCEEILSNLRHHADLQGINFNFNFEEEALVQDKTRLKIILNNLLSNAIHFQKRNTESTEPFVRVSSHKAGDKVQIVIEDNGEGIHTEQQKQIFDMFYRGNERSIGSGLGLYIAKEAASKIKGSIRVLSEFGKGTTFIVELINLS
jgi:two-component system, sensor histidine kinase